jgi:mannitol operon repressor
MTDDELKDFNAFLMEFQDETDRGAALVAAAQIDHKLKETLTAFFAHRKVGKELLDGGNAPLGTLSARIKTTFCLGLIGRDEYHECNLIRQIRNEFAHRTHGTKFSDPKIAGYCLDLKMWIPTGTPPAKESPRNLFLHSVFFIALRLSNRSQHAAAEKRKIRPQNPIRRIDAVAGPAPHARR